MGGHTAHSGLTLLRAAREGGQARFDGVGRQGHGSEIGKCGTGWLEGLLAVAAPGGIPINSHGDE